MNLSADLQQHLDTTGRLADIPGTLELEVPLFIDRPEVYVGGLNVGAFYSGSFAVIGHRRGLVDDFHYPHRAWRTCGDTHLLVEDGFNCGPTAALAGPDRGWSSQSRFRIRFSGESHGPEGWTQRKTQGGDFTHSFLFGMYGHGDGLEPSPWYLAWMVLPGQSDLALALVFRTSDGDVNHLVVPADRLDARLDLDLFVDLAAGTAEATVNGHPVAPTFDHDPTTPALADNFVYPFCLGKFEWSVNSTNFPAPVLDFTTRELAYEGGNGWNFRINLQWGRPQTYDGGPSLPLVQFGGTAPTRFAHAVHWTQGHANQAVGKIRFADLNITGMSSNPAIVVRCLNNKFDLDYVSIDDGSTGLLMHSPGGTVYQTTLDDCHFSGQHGYQIRGHRAHVTVRDSVMGRAHQGVTHTRGGNVALENVFIPAPGPPAAPYVFHQSGGRGAYINCHSNYEYAPASPVLVDLTPISWDAPEAQTDLHIERCILDRVEESYFLRPRHGKYCGDVNINDNGTRRHIEAELIDDVVVETEYTSGEFTQRTRQSSNPNG